MDPSETAATPPGDPHLAARATRSSLWSVTGNAAQTLLGSLAFVVLSRWISPAEYGLVGMATSITGFLGVLGDSGMVAALVRLPAIDEVAETTAFWVALAGAAGLTLVSAAAAPLVAAFFQEPRVGPISAALALTFVLAAPARVGTARLTRDLAFRELAWVGWVSNLAGILAAVVVAWRGGGAWALVVQTLVTIVAQTGLILVRAGVALRRGAFSRPMARELAAFGSRMSGFSVAIVIGRSLDGVLAGKYLGPEPLGLLSFGMRLVPTAVQRLVYAVTAVFMPAVVKLPPGKRQGTAFATVARLLALGIFPACLGVVAVEPGLEALFPGKWAGIGPIAAVMTVGAAAEPLGALATATLTAQGRAGEMFRIALWLIGVSWTGAILSVRTGEIFWVAVAWGAGNWVGALWLLQRCWRSLELGPWFWRRLAGPALLSAGMAAAVRVGVHAAGLEGSRTGFAAGVGLGVTLYVAGVFVFMNADVRRVHELLVRRGAALGDGGAAAG